MARLNTNSRLTHVALAYVERFCTMPNLAAKKGVYFALVTCKIQFIVMISGTDDQVCVD